jgi:hypothetical protein
MDAEHAQPEEAAKRGHGHALSVEGPSFVLPEPAL